MMIMRSLKASPLVPTWRQFEEGEDDMEQFLDAILRLAGLGHFHSTGFQIWPLLMLFLNSLQNNIFWKNLCKDFCSYKSRRNTKFDILHRRKWMPDVSPLQNVKFRMPLTFTAAKVFVNIFSRKYYFANCLEIILTGAKFWTLWHMNSS